MQVLFYYSSESRNIGRIAAAAATDKAYKFKGRSDFRCKRLRAAGLADSGIRLKVEGQMCLFMEFVYDLHALDRSMRAVGAYAVDAQFFHGAAELLNGIAHHGTAALFKTH